jgi:hypothetical protein
MICAFAKIPSKLAILQKSVICKHPNCFNNTIKFRRYGVQSNKRLITGSSKRMSRELTSLKFKNEKNAFLNSRLKKLVF